MSIVSDKTWLWLLRQLGLRKPAGVDAVPPWRVDREGQVYLPEKRVVLKAKAGGQSS